MRLKVKTSAFKKKSRNEKAQINWALIVCPQGEVNKLFTRLLTIPVASG